MIPHPGPTIPVFSAVSVRYLSHFIIIHGKYEASNQTESLRFQDCERYIKPKKEAISFDMTSFVTSYLFRLSAQRTVYGIRAR